MHRTQVYLKESERRILHLISQQEHVSLSDPIRRAIEQASERTGKERNLEKAVDSIAGIWAGRDDIGSTENYIRSLRKGKRLKRLYG
jgi:hypothetical protein